MLSRGRAGRIGAALAVLSMSLVLIMSPQVTAPAAALSGAEPITIGQRLRTIPADKVAKVGGTALRMNPYVRAGTLILGGLMIVDGYFTLHESFSENGPQGETTILSCRSGQGTFTVTVSNMEGRSFDFYGQADNCGFSSGTQNYRAFCRMPNGQIVARDGFIGRPDRSGTIGPQTANGCLAGDVLESLEWLQNMPDAGGLVAPNGYPAEDHTATTTVECRGPGGEIRTVSRTVRGEPGTVLIPSCEQEFGEGWIPNRIERESGPDYGTKVPDFDVVVDPTLYTEYPDCFSNGALTCVVTVWVDGTPCTPDRAVCAEWWSINKDDPHNVACRFGPYRVTKNECRQLRNSYKTGTRTDTETTPDGDVRPKPVPGPGPGPGPGTEVFPPEGPNPQNPPTDPDPEVDPNSRSCFADAWSWNPVDWVYVPVKCALIWAFVPKNPPSFSNVSVTIPPGWVPELPSVSGSCGPLTMPAISIPGVGMVGGTAFVNTCEAPWTTIRTVTFYGLGALAFVVLAHRLFSGLMTAAGMGVEQGGGGGDL